MGMVYSNNDLNEANAARQGRAGQGLLGRGPSRTRDTQSRKVSSNCINGFLEWTKREVEMMKQAKQVGI